MTQKVRDKPAALGYNDRVKTSFVVNNLPATRLWLPVLVARQDFVIAVVQRLRTGPCAFTGKREIENLLKEYVMAYGINTLRGIVATPEEQTSADAIIDRYFPEFR